MVSAAPRHPWRTLALSTGITMAYLDHRPVGGSPIDPPIVLLHGLTNSAETWTPTVEALALLLPRTRILAVDLRGHGRTSVPPACDEDPAHCLSIESMAADVVAFIQALGVDRMALVGHSMGSLIGQVVALRHPERVSSLILISTTGDATATPILGDWLLNDVISTQWRRALEEQGVGWPRSAMSRAPIDADPQATAWMQQFWNVYPVGPRLETHVVAQAAAELPLRTWFGATSAIMSFRRTAELTALTTPTLVLWGVQDAFFLRADQDALVTALTAAGQAGGRFCWKQYGVIDLADDGLQHDDLGHNLTWEVPQQVAADIASFLTTGRPTTTAWRTNAPGAIDEVLAEPGRALITSDGTG